MNKVVYLFGLDHGAGLHRDVLGLDVGHAGGLVLHGVHHLHLRLREEMG